MHSNHPQEKYFPSNQGENEIPHKIQIKYESIQIGKPKNTPFEARITRSTYQAPVFATLNIKIDDEEYNINSSIGNIPLMVLSDNCNLLGQDLIALKEDKYEIGGFFIINELGVYKLICIRNFITESLESLSGVLLICREMSGMAFVFS